MRHRDEIDAKIHNWTDNLDHIWSALAEQVRSAGSKPRSHLFAGAESDVKIAKVGKLYDSSTPRFIFHGEENVAEVSVGRIRGLVKPTLGIPAEPDVDEDQLSLNDGELEVDEEDDDDE